MATGDKISIAKIQLSDEEIGAVSKVLRSGQLAQGETVRAFERAFAEKVGAKYAVAVSSGTAALHIAYLALLHPGDEVIVPAFTHISTASMVYHAGGKPVFCDINSRTFTLDVGDAERKLTSKTKAIAPVHLFGNGCEIMTILDFAREHSLFVIWDAAQAHGTKYQGRDVGSFDDVVCYSFYPTKNMMTGEGGMIVTNSEELDERCRLLRSHGQEKKYYHTVLGFNYRMTELQAAMGIQQLARLDGNIRKRRENAAYLTNHLAQLEGLAPPFVREGTMHTYNQYSILLDLQTLRCTRDSFVQMLHREGIEAAVHYPIPLHKQPVFQGTTAGVYLPVSEETAQRILSLPVHPCLSQAELKRIVQVVTNVVNSVKRACS